MDAFHVEGRLCPSQRVQGVGVPQVLSKQKRGLPSLAVPVALDLTGGGRDKGMAVPFQKQRDLFPDRI